MQQIADKLGESRSGAENIPTGFRRSPRIGWYLFDFSGEILMTNGGLYFLPWLAKDNLVSDSWFNVALVVTSLFLIATGPFLGRLHDRSQQRRFFLWSTSLGMFIATLGIHLADRLATTGLIKGGVGLLFFCVLMYCYQLSLIFYNSLLNDVAKRQDITKTSGFGAAIGWAGALLGIMLVWPFVAGIVPLFHGSGNSQAFLPSAIFYAIGTAISLALMRGIAAGQQRHDHVAWKHLYFETWRDLRQTVRRTNVWYFLLALFLFGDAVLTIENNASYYLLTVMRYSDNAKNELFGLLLITAMVGGMISAGLANKIKPKQLLVGILAGWIITLAIISVTTNQTLFTILFGLVGLLFGALGSVMRAFFLLMLPPDRKGQYFGVYASFQRFSTFIGPLVWIAVARMFASSGVAAYRASMASMAVLICASLYFLKKVSDTANDTPKKTKENQ